MAICNPVNIIRRPIKAEDQPILFELYASTRREELACTGWPRNQMTQFLAGQFTLQHNAYHHQFLHASFELIFIEEQPVGRLYVDREKDILIVDISLFPQFRNQGIGTRLLEGLLAEAEKTNCPICLHVERNNPAYHLYKRLGFQVLSEDEMRFFMQYQPTHKPKK